MSTLDEKLEEHRETVGAAQRTFRSLAEARGGAVPVGPQDGRMVVTICPMDTRSFWHHEGNGRWDAMGAMYTKLEE